MASGNAGSIHCKVSEKGAISVYGLGQFPVTLYAEQWQRLFAEGNRLRSYLRENRAKLKTKPAGDSAGQAKLPGNPNPKVGSSEGTAALQLRRPFGARPLARPTEVRRILEPPSGDSKLALCKVCGSWVRIDRFERHQSNIHGIAPGHPAAAEVPAQEQFGRSGTGSARQKSVNSDVDGRGLRECACHGNNENCNVCWGSGYYSTSIHEVEMSPNLPTLTRDDASGTEATLILSKKKSFVSPRGTSLPDERGSELRPSGTGARDGSRQRVESREQSASWIDLPPELRTAQKWSFDETVSPGVVEGKRTGRVAGGIWTPRNGKKTKGNSRPPVSKAQDVLPGSKASASQKEKGGRYQQTPSDERTDSEHQGRKTEHRLDGSRDFYQVRESGKFGSHPIYDDMDDDSKP